MPAEGNEEFERTSAVPLESISKDAVNAPLGVGDNVADDDEDMVYLYTATEPREQAQNATPTVGNGAANPVIPKENISCATTWRKIVAHVLVPAKGVGLCVAVFISIEHSALSEKFTSLRKNVQLLRTSYDSCMMWTEHSSLGQLTVC
ncbi:hypothetical protein QR680_013461 [Steinernema hermaphroditum]|uniref:Uncharacterized protein n=1 Tax=Steinernema hermaphroditum TaxID=289476 RepID=A0AA39I880_9BILA|nr:hypothetical protein QR680_013461 [Steinernema hermaphroditum]